MNALVTNPLVSIVIPVYNRELYIEDAIDLLLVKRIKISRSL